MRNGTIQVDQLWKRFRADRAPKRLREWLPKTRGLHRRASERWRWVLRDVTFRIEPGESLGLMGLNGCGKSTLLKILNQVMYPHTGSIQVAGRVGALIALQAGIHPELTGRENVYMYGLLVGFSRAGISRRFEEIVDFAGVGDALDRPMKFYSTGMQMRLAFSVAAFLEPDVLLVDEVLSVGDAAFQQRCLGRIDELIGTGTTLILVSHDLAVVEATCKRGLWLEKGIIAADGPIEDVLGRYRATIERSAESEIVGDAIVTVTLAVAATPGGGQIQSNGPAELRVHMKSTESCHATIWLGVTEGTATPILVFRHETDLCEGETQLTCTVSCVPLPAGAYYLWGCVKVGAMPVIPWRPFRPFEVLGLRRVHAPVGVMQLAPVQVQCVWTRS